MARRRAKGEGALWQKGGTWFAEVVVGYTDGGAPKRKRVQARTQREVVAKLTELRAASAAGLLPDAGGQTVRQFSTWWLEQRKDKLKPTTHARYKTCIETQALPHLGGVRVDKLSPIHVRTWLNALAKSGTSARLQAMARTVLHGMLEDAVRMNAIARNPIVAVEAPRVKKKQMRTLSIAEAKKFLDAARSDRLYALYVLALRTGMRQGELLGLKWDDVDLKGKTLAVRRALTEVGGRPELASTKTDKGRRVDLDDACAKALKEHKERMLSEGVTGSGLVFVDTVGGFVRKSNLIRRSLRRLVDAHEDRRRLHVPRSPPHACNACPAGWRASEGRPRAARAFVDYDHARHLLARRTVDAAGSA